MNWFMLFVVIIAANFVCYRLDELFTHNMRKLVKKIRKNKKMKAIGKKENRANIQIGFQYYKESEEND